MLLVNNTNNVIIAIVKTAEEVENGIYVDRGLFDANGVKKDLVYANLNNEIRIYNVAAPVEVQPHKYCYDEENGFHVNQEYVEVLSTEVEIQRLKEQVDTLQKFIDDAILGGTL